jgi:hypothetical protein
MELMKVLLETAQPKAYAMETNQYHGMNDSLENENSGIAEEISYTSATLPRRRNDLYVLNQELLPQMRRKFLVLGNEIFQANHSQVWIANRLFKSLKYTLNSRVNNGQLWLDPSHSRKVYYCRKVENHKIALRD